MKNMKILITGATGFIGNSLTKLLLDKNYEIHCIVRKNSNISKLPKRAKTFIYDKNINSLLEFFSKEQFCGVIHLASLVLRSHTKDDISNLISSNIKFGCELLEASTKTDVKWFINTGTFWQNYQNQDYKAVNFYAATKEAFSVMAKYYTQTSNLVFTTIKLNDTFGENDTRDKILNLWGEISKSKEVLQMTDGKQIMDISYIEDVVSAYDILISHLTKDNKGKFKNTEFVVTNKQKVSLKELAKIFEEATKLKLNIIWGAIAYKTNEILVPYNKGQIIPNWKQKYTLKEAIKKVYGS